MQFKISSICLQVNYQASLREAYRTLKDHTERQQRGQLVDAGGQFDHAAQKAMETRVTNLMLKVSSCMSIATYILSEICFVLV